MTLLSDQLERIAWLRQDASPDATTISKMILQHQEALATLARTDYFPQIVWINALTAIARYLMPLTVAHIAFVLYNERTLRFVTEASLDRSKPGWERMTGEPDYWTMDNQAPSTIRLVPAPLRDGSAVPIIPGLPIMQDPVDNILVFLYEDVSLQVDDPTDTLPTMLDVDDWLVYATVQALAGQETSEQNLPVSQAAGQIAALWMQLIGKG